MRAMAYKNYLVVVLLVILSLNYMDRLIFGIVLQDIKRDLNLTDTQLGLLGGIAFAFFYAIMGIPIARWADRGNRVTIISLTAGLWSLATALCGAATSFVQLLLIRVGVAVGEAGCYPTALSLISDTFTRAERPRAVSRYMLGIPIALVVGNFAAGWLNELYGWRLTFVIFGLPGLAVALLAAMTLKEPRRAGILLKTAEASVVPPSRPAAPSLREVFSTLWTNVAFRNLLICFSVWGFFGNGILQWQPAFFLRSHGLGTGELGTWFAVVYGVGGLLGTYVGGELATRYAANNETLQLKAIAISYVAIAVLTSAMYLAQDKLWAFVLLGGSGVLGAATNGPLFASVQSLVPPPMRAMAIALMYFFCNLIGMGFGPLAVGMLSDALTPWLAEESLRYALLAFAPGYFWCAWHIWKASRTVERDVFVDDPAMAT